MTKPNSADKNCTLVKGGIYETEVTDVNNFGDGIGRINGIAVFIKGGVTGDRLRVQIIKTAKSYAVARIEEVLSASSYRGENDCAAYKRCGGCVSRHITYEYELELKRGFVAAAFRRAGLSDIVVHPVQTADKADGYRNKAQYPIGFDSKSGRLKIGFFAGHTHEICDCCDCRLSPDIFGKIVSKLRAFFEEKRLSAYDESTGRGMLRHIYLRYGEMTGEVLLCIVINAKSLPCEPELIELVKREFPQVVGVLVNINTENTNVVLSGKYRLLYGRDYIFDELCGRRFKISKSAFYQVNRAAAELLYNKASNLAALADGETLVDLYCGVGTVGMCMANRENRLLGVEIVPEAIDNARENAELNAFENASFVSSDAVGFTKYLEDGAQPNVIAVDPPRKGLDPKVISDIASLEPDRVVYISCNPDTLARDVKLFGELGYGCTEAFPFDLFPRTGHVETVCLLSKLQSKEHIEIEVDMDELDLTAAESKATYEEIREYVFEHTGLKVSHLYIAQVKQKYGIIERENYNKPKSENAKQPQCPPEKEKAITEAFNYFGML